MVSQRLVLVAALFATNVCFGSATLRGNSASNQNKRDNVKELRDNLKSMHEQIEAYVTGKTEVDENTIKTLQQRALLYQALLEDHHLLDEEKSNVILEKMQLTH